MTGRICEMVLYRNYQSVQRVGFSRILWADRSDSFSGYLAFESPAILAFDWRRMPYTKEN